MLILGSIIAVLLALLLVQSFQYRRVLRRVQRKYPQDVPQGYWQHAPVHAAAMRLLRQRAQAPDALLLDYQRVYRRLAMTCAILLVFILVACWLDAQATL